MNSVVQNNRQFNNIPAPFTDFIVSCDLQSRSPCYVLRPFFAPVRQNQYSSNVLVSLAEPQFVRIDQILIGAGRDDNVDQQRARAKKLICIANTAYVFGLLGAAVGAFALLNGLTFGLFFLSLYTIVALSIVAFALLCVVYSTCGYSNLMATLKDLQIDYYDTALLNYISEEFPQFNYDIMDGETNSVVCILRVTERPEGTEPIRAVSLRPNVDIDDAEYADEIDYEEDTEYAEEVL